MPAPARHAPTPHDPRRSAHRTIHGFLYQSVLAAHRWLELAPAELLFCEGDEDHDVLVGDRRDATQVKAYEQALGLNDAAVRESLAGFAVAFAARAREQVEERFVFVTTAPARRSGKAARVLQAWREQEAHARSTEVVPFVRELLQELPTATRAWFDAEPARWSAFVAAVDWRFDTPDLDEQLTALQAALSADLRCRHLPSELLAKRLLLEMADAARRPDPAGRCVDAARLVELLGQTTAAIDRSLREPVNAARLLAIEDARRLSERLVPGTQQRRAEITGVGQLLGAAYETVEWNERLHGAELQDLLAWCSESATIELRLVTGVGGAGKTRLAIELIRRARAAGWQAGFLRDPSGKERRSDRADEEADLLLRGSDPRLLVIDYAETRQGALEHLLSILADAREANEKRQMAPVRVLLLARNAGDWWTRLKSPTLRRSLADWLETVVPQELPPLALEGATREELFWQAVMTFQRLLGRTPAGNRVDFADPVFDRVLFLHMAALALVEGKVVRGRVEILEATREHEARFWARECQHYGGQGAGGGDQVQREKLEAAFPRAVAALTLINGALDEDEARRYLARVTAPKEGDLPLDLGTLLRRLRSIYAADRRSNAARYLTGLEPDLFGEYHVGCLLRDTAAPPDARRHPFLDSLFPASEDENLANAFVVLGRAATDDPQHESWIRALLTERVDERGVAAFQAALAVGSRTAHSPLGRVLAEVANLEGSRALAARLDPFMPKQTVGLRELAAWSVATLRNMGRTAPVEEEIEESAIAEQARLANNDSVRQSELGRREEALKSAEEATTLYRRLAKSRPDAFEPDLAMSLNNLGSMLSELGRREEALKSAEEATTLYRRLAKSRPDAFEPDLALSLNNLGSMLSELGRREEALKSAEEAATLCRRLAKSRPNAFEPDLAVSLNNLGNRLSALGRREEAVSAAREAVAVLLPHLRRLPEAYRDWGLTMARNYLRYSEAACSEPDAALLAEVAAAVKSSSL